MKAKLIKDNDGYWLDISDDGITKLPLIDFGQLSKENCEAIANGYDLDELAESEYGTVIESVRGSKEYDIEADRKSGFKAGFQKALELLGDKKFSEEDVLKELNKLNTMPNSILDTFTDDGEMVTMKWFEQSLQRTEWDVEIETTQIPADRAPGGWDIFPKLDSDGNLILKRI
jgi:hypothetical protein